MKVAINLALWLTEYQINVCSSFYLLLRKLHSDMLYYVTILLLNIQ